MSSQERWDVVMVILSGPLRSPAEHIHRGPIVRIGHNPGPGGMQLAGYRGLDARQCTIKAYSNSAEISPVGKNQVRIAPHSNVNWRDIDPINGPTFLSNGCAVHIGPVGRGATLQFVECRRLGVWEGGDIRSEVQGGATGHGNLHGHGGGIGEGGVPTAYDARKVRKVAVSSVPAWFMGCIGLILTSTATLLVVVTGLVLYGRRDVADLGPISDDYEYLPYVTMDREPDAKLLKGLEQPMLEWVMGPNMAAAEGGHTGLENPKNWDRNFMRYVTRSVELHVKQRRFFKNLDARRSEWAIVVKQLRRAGMPEVFAAIPYQESLYNSNAQSFVCAKGYWQFMPETANRVDKLYNTEFRVRGCRMRGRTEKWSPKDYTPPFTRNAPYVEDNQCLITTCDVDDRTDLRKSTAGAILTLKEAWDNDEVKASGAAVQLTILSHNAGADDAPYGKAKASNVIPALRRWVRRSGPAQAPNFYGQNILCETNHGLKPCGSLIMPETQHYAYNIVAQHFIAVCYYAQEYSSMPEFEPWATWALDDSYCEQFDIPTKTEVRSW